MSQHETDHKYAISEFVGILEEKDRMGPVIRIRSNDESLERALLDHIEEESGIHFGPLEDVPDQSKSFGFSNWNGSSWVPEGPKPNWVAPDKKLN